MHGSNVLSDHPPLTGAIIYFPRLLSLGGVLEKPNSEALCIRKLFKPEDRHSEVLNFSTPKTPKCTELAGCSWASGRFHATSMPRCDNLLGKEQGSPLFVLTELLLRCDPLRLPARNQSWEKSRILKGRSRFGKRRFVSRCPSRPTRPSKSVPDAVFLLHYSGDRRRS